MTQAEVAGQGAEVDACPTACRRHAARGPLLATAAWLSAAVAALAVAALPFNVGGSPRRRKAPRRPFSALVAMHLFRFVALGAGVHATTRFRPGLVRSLGVVLVVVAVAGAVMVLGGDLSRWLDQVPDGYQSFWPHRLAYTLATKTDLPLVQAITAGVACLFLAKRSTRSKLESKCETSRWTRHVQVASFFGSRSFDH